MAPAHILGIPVQETALSFVPVLLVLVAGVRICTHRLHGKLRRGAARPTRESRLDQTPAGRR